LFGFRRVFVGTESGSPTRNNADPVSRLDKNLPTIEEPFFPLESQAADTALCAWLSRFNLIETGAVSLGPLGAEGGDTARLWAAAACWGAGQLPVHASPSWLTSTSPSLTNTDLNNYPSINQIQTTSYQSINFNLLDINQSTFIRINSQESEETVINLVPDQTAALRQVYTGIV
jgi:hypothetical protein